MLYFWNNVERAHDVNGSRTISQYDNWYHRVFILILLEKNLDPLLKLVQLHFCFEWNREFNLWNKMQTSVFP